MRKVFVIVIILLFIGASVVSGFSINLNPQPLSRGWLYVGGSGSGNYSTIQSAINDANPGDTVFVYSGTYNENVVIELMKTNISLKGENKSTTTINADESAMASIYVDRTHSVTISGFTLHCPLMPGIYFRDSSDNIIFDCIMSNCNDGVVIYTEHIGMNNTVKNCEIYNNTRDGIYIGGANINYYLNQSNVFNCSIYNNGDGIHIYGRVDWSGIINNTVISGCNVFNNIDKGIFVNQLSGNISGLTIYHNNLFNNTINAYDNSTNAWNDSYPSGGNYWGDYSGVDIYSGPNQDIPGSDGIGDTPYDLPCEHAIDWYPFMEPNGWMNKPPIANFSSEMNGLSVTFNASSSYDSDGNISTWLWDFGDGVEGAGEIVTHDYQKSGTCIVTLTVIDEDGGKDSITQEITVESHKKAIIFGRIANLTTEGDTITFEAINTRIIAFAPFSWTPYTSGEKIIIAKGYSGFIGYRYVLTLCRMLV